MKAGRCQATAASGKPCSAAPRPGRPFCLWHDPEAAEQRRALSRKGGAARSNQARAKKALPAGVLTSEELRGVVGITIKRVLAGATEPAVGNSVANLARAYVAVTEATALADEVAAIKEALGLGSERTA